MNFRDYLERHDLSDVEMADRLGVSHQAVEKWRYGYRIPRMTTIKLISIITRGKVTANDWMDEIRL